MSLDHTISRLFEAWIEEIELMRPQRPLLLVPKLFTELRTRYLNRPGGYTRVLRVEPLKEDQAPSAILELIDGPRDMRFAMTAKTLVKERASEDGIRELTARNVIKVTRYRERGQEELEKTVKFLEESEKDEERRKYATMKRKVYPPPPE